MRRLLHPWIPWFLYVQYKKMSENPLVFYACDFLSMFQDILSVNLNEEEKEKKRQEFQDRLKRMIVQDEEKDVENGSNDWGFSAFFPSCLFHILWNSFTIQVRLEYLRVLHVWSSFPSTSRSTWTSHTFSDAREGHQKDKDEEKSRGKRIYMVSLYPWSLLPFVLLFFVKTEEKDSLGMTEMNKYRGAYYS